MKFAVNPFRTALFWQFSFEGALVLASHILSLVVVCEEKKRKK
jgi:hypothetical protein